MSSLRKTIFALFFVSGFCGLLYQVVWVRLAFTHFGIITPVLSVVVSVFMLGLSLGSWLGGKWISRRRPFSAIYAYGLTEFVIGIGAFVVPKLFPIGATWLLPGGDMNSWSYLFLSAIIISLSILPWCVLMGATFPLMMAFIQEQESSTETSFSFLYLANVIGAMCGTILTADVLVELLGFKHTLAVAGLSNFGIAAASLALGIKFPYRSAARLTPVPSPTGRGMDVEDDRGEAWRKSYVILFITGLTSMSLEVIWVRNFTPVVGTTVYAFALIVAIYLLATWMGSSLYRKHVASRKVLSVADLLAALAVSSLLTILVNDPRLHLRQTGVIVGIFPFSFLLGYLTPGLIDRTAQGDPDRAGRAYAVNIVGCILGPLLASYLFLPYLGVKASMILMALPFGVMLGLEFNRLDRRWRFPVTVFTGIFLITAVAVNRSYEEQFPGGVIRRDATATVISVGSGMNKMLLVNGVGITSMATVTKVMAHLPLLLVPQPPHTALDICFGMGTTYRSLLTWDGLQVTAVELVPSVKQAFGYYHADAAQVMANPRGRVVIDDGRRFLSRTNEMFDVVTIDPPPPIEAAGSSLLYTREFYKLIKKRLRPHGVLQQWFPGGPTVEAQAIARSLTDEFPYVKIYIWSKEWGVHFLASDQPIDEPSVAEAMRRLPPAAKRDLVEWEPYIRPEQLLARIFSQTASVEKLLSPNKAISITDDRPFNEYYLLRRSWAHYRKMWSRS